MTELYKENLTAALEYQDFIIEQLRKSSPCIIITPFSSQKYQYEKGESAQGIEIKYDRRMKETGNVYIEVAEKPVNTMKTTLSAVYTEKTIHGCILSATTKEHCFFKKDSLYTCMKTKDIGDTEGFGK